MSFGPLGRDEGYRQVAGGNPHHPKEFAALHGRFDRPERALAGSGSGKSADAENPPDAPLPQLKMDEPGSLLFDRIGKSLGINGKSYDAARGAVEIRAARAIDPVSGWPVRRRRRRLFAGWPRVGNAADPSSSESGKE